MRPFRASAPARVRSRIDGCAPSRARRLLRLGTPRIPICFARPIDPGLATIWLPSPNKAEGGHMAESVYRVTDIIGVSSESWEDAARNAVKTAAGSLRDLRVAEVVKLDITIEDGKVARFRTRLNVSFKYEK